MQSFIERSELHLRIGQLLTIGLLIAALFPITACYPTSFPGPTTSPEATTASLPTSASDTAGLKQIDRASLHFVVDTTIQELVAPTPSPTPTPGGSSALKQFDLATLQSVVDKTAEEHFVPGAVVLLVTPQGEFTTTYGTTEKGKEIVPTADTFFRIASNTKTMTAAIVMQLAQEGKLKLDDPVSKYVPDVPNGDNITVAQLLEMRSGLYNYTDSSELTNVLDTDPSKAWTPAEMLGIAFHHPPNDPPGTVYEYNNTNFVLLGLIIEAVDNKSLAQSMQDRLFGPLGMKNTYLPARDDATLPEPYTHGYLYGSTSVAMFGEPHYTPEEVASAKAGILQPNDYTNLNPSWGWASGGAVSTARDLAIWVKALVGGQVLNPEYQRIWLNSIQPEDPNNPQGQKYGYGIAEYAWGPNEVYFHGGETAGYNSKISYDPVNDVTMIIWSNLTLSPDEQQPANSLFLNLLDAIYQVSPLSPTPPPGPTPQVPASLPAGCIDTSGHTVRMVTVAPGVELEVLDWGGSGEPLVLLTGFGDNAHVFDNFAHQFTDKFHVYGITRRGFGASGKPSSGYDVDTRANDYIAVLDALNIPAANFAGHSLAGEELSKLGSAHPDRVKKLVYMDAYEYGNYSKLPPVPVPELTDADTDSLNHYAAVLTRFVGIREPNAALCNANVFDSSGRIVGSVTPPEISAQVFVNQKQADLEKIQAPFLGIFNVSTDDTKLPLYYSLTPAQQTEFDAAWTAQLAWKRDTINRFRTLVKNSQVIELQNSDHYIYIYDEAEVARLMRDFLLAK